MAEISISSIVDSLKNPATVGVGVAVGIKLQKSFISKIFSNETLKGYLGAETTSTVQKWATPVVTSLLGVLISGNVEDRTMKALANGIAASGVVTLASNTFFKQDLLAGFLGLGNSEEDEIEKAVLEAKAEINKQLQAADEDEDEDLDGEDEDEDLDGEEYDEDLDGDEDEDLDGDAEYEDINLSAVDFV